MENKENKKERVPIRRSSGRRKKRKLDIRNISFLIIIPIIIILGIVVSIKKYSPTKEHLELSSYYILNAEDEVAVIINGVYDDEKEREAPDAVVAGGIPFINIKFLKQNLDDGYVYDSDEEVLRYTTEDTLISAKPGDLSYSKGKDSVDMNADIILPRVEGAYINMEFVKQFTDCNYVFTSNPNRMTVETAGNVKSMATLKKNTALRRFGGPKSKILKDGKKGEPVRVLEDYGKWSAVLSEDGVIGCVKNSHLSKTVEETVPQNLPDRNYTHNLLNKKVVLGWHQVMNPNANSTISGVTENASSMNVISPTWYKIADNGGNIKSISSLEYVNTCHSMGLDVWPLISNFEVEGVDSTTVLNHVSSRDNLVNSLIGAAIRDNVDGLCIDFESLSIDSKDGFIQFIRELSLKCKNNEIVLSVVNYKPEAHTSFYNRAEQAKYADYVICVGYDEYHGDSDTAGSNSSFTFVKDGIDDTLKEVPKEQLIEALAFYTRIWNTENGVLTQKAISMKEANSILNQYNPEKVWLKDNEQYYVKFDNNGRSSEIWLEEEESLSRKLSYCKENDLAGYAFWKLGFEPSSIWDVVSGYIK